MTSPEKRGGFAKALGHERRQEESIDAVQRRYRPQSYFSIPFLDRDPVTAVVVFMVILVFASRGDNVLTTLWRVLFDY